MFIASNSSTIPLTPNTVEVTLSGDKTQVILSCSAQDERMKLPISSSFFTTTLFGVLIGLVTCQPCTFPSQKSLRQSSDLECSSAP